MSWDKVRKEKTHSYKWVRIFALRFKPNGLKMNNH